MQEEFINKLKDEKLKELYTNLFHLNKEVSKIEKAIKALQEICNHKFIDNGHDSHYSYSICIFCGYERRD